MYVLCHVTSSAFPFGTAQRPSLSRVGHFLSLLPLPVTYNSPSLIVMKRSGFCSGSAMALIWAWLRGYTPFA